MHGKVTVEHCRQDICTCKGVTLQPCEIKKTRVLQLLFFQFVSINIWSHVWWFPTNIVCSCNKCIQGFYLCWFELLLELSFKTYWQCCFPSMGFFHIQLTHIFDKLCDIEFILVNDKRSTYDNDMYESIMFLWEGSIISCWPRLVVNNNNTSPYGGTLNTQDILHTIT